MKKTSFKKKVTGILLMICLIILPVIIKAEGMSPSLYFGITELGESGMGYSIGNPNANSTTATAAKIWNILRYSTSETIGGYATNVYCVRAGAGFTSNGGTNSSEEYNLKFDMYEDREQIASQDQSTSNQILYNLVNRNNGSDYNSLLALANLVYIPEQSTEDEKETLLRNAGILAILEGEGLSQDYYLTDDEIKSIQQAAIWYFTNSDQPEIYDNYEDQEGLWLWYTTEEGTTYQNFSSYENASQIGITKQRHAAMLYRYLIDTAKAQASNYADGTAKPKNSLTLYASAENKDAQPLMEITKIPQEFDLSLRKYITKINDQTLTNTRIPNIDETTLSTGTTAIYKHRKDPVIVNVGDKITYSITIYNEGDISGRATQIVDQLPTGLKFSQVVTEGFIAEYNEETNRVTITRAENNTENLTPYEQNKLDSETIEIECIVESNQNGTTLTNVAWIAEEIDENGNIIKDTKGQDRDSEPGTTPNVNKDNMNDYIGNTNNSNKTLTNSEEYFEGQQDDDDFEKVVVNIVEDDEFDLKLIKMLTAVNGNSVTKRLLGVDTTNLANGTQSTAQYQMNKTPVIVSTGDLITYTLRIYNEGDIDGYAEEITEDIPAGLEFLGADVDANMNTITDKDELAAVQFNTSMGWTYVEGDTSKITTNYLGKGKGEELTTEGANLIKAFNPNNAYSDTATNKNPDYKEISVILKVVAENSEVATIRNEAAITEDADSNGNPVDDRDSNTENWVKYEDDEDYDIIILQEFDLSLKKFITKVDEENITTREPEVSYNREEDKITYNHTKEPVEVAVGDIVEYTIRVYNEGDMAGYAEEIADDIPYGLKYLPENATNTEYRWVMYDVQGNITTNVEEAVEIRTDYLSREQGESTNLIKAFNAEEEIGEGNPDYRDVKVVFEVEETNSTESIINSAQITDDRDENGNPVEDKDSIPDKWNEGEDDQDREYIKLTHFDLSLKKWVTESIVIQDGKETITQTGNTAETNPESVVKVEIYRKDINNVVVKFKYKIRVTNEGDIEGYAEEITDYVPKGLKFEAEDNPGWTDEGNNVISTRMLEKTLLKPGESAEVEVVLTWINGQDNMGTKTNIAEISEDYNEKDVPDRDSTPDNKQPGEDDMDDSSVLLSIETGQQRIYFTLGLTILGTLAIGLVLIKKFVL